MKCPKCGHEQINKVECENCGIIFRKYINNIAKKKLEEAKELYNNNELESANRIFQALINTKAQISNDIRLASKEYANSINGKKQSSTTKEKNQNLNTDQNNPVEQPNLSSQIKPKFTQQISIRKLSVVFCLILVLFSLSGGAIFLLKANTDNISGKHKKSTATIDKSIDNTQESQELQLSNNEVRSSVDYKVLDNFIEILNESRGGNL